MYLILEISKSEDKYEATIRSFDEKSHDKKSIFRTIEPLNKNELFGVLTKLKFHEGDIHDAFNQADGIVANAKHPLWDSIKNQ